MQTGRTISFYTRAAELRQFLINAELLAHILRAESLEVRSDMRYWLKLSKQMPRDRALKLRHLNLASIYSAAPICKALAMAEGPTADRASPICT
jgi:hypothetical protein